MSTVQVPQFTEMDLERLQEVREQALETKLSGVDFENRKWILAYVDALIAQARGDSEELHSSRY